MQIRNVYMENGWAMFRRSLLLGKVLSNHRVIFIPETKTLRIKAMDRDGLKVGPATDLPVSHDWNDDTLYEIGVYRPSNQLFYLKIGLNASDNVRAARQADHQEW